MKFVVNMFVAAVLALQTCSLYRAAKQAGVTIDLADPDPDLVQRLRVAGGL